MSAPARTVFVRALVAFAPALAVAQAAALRSAEARLTALESRVARLEGGLVNQRLETLRADLEDAPEIPLRPRGGPRLSIESTDGAFRLRIGGRLQLDAGTFTQSRRFAAERGRLEDGVAFRRARIDVRARLHRNLHLSVGCENRGGRAALLPAFFELRGLPGRTRVRVGFTRAPLTLQAATSSLHLPHFERGVVNRLAPGLRSGLFLSGTDAAERLRWHLSLYRETDLRGASAPRDDEAYGLALRLRGDAWRGSEGGRLHLGFGIAGEDYGNAGVRFRERPGLRLLDFTVDTGRLEARRGLTLSAEVALQLGAFDASADAVWLRLSGVAGRPWLVAYQARASWFITGESRDFDTRRGGFARLRPHRPWPDGPGAWELGLRFEHLELDAGGVGGGEQTQTTLLLAWHLDGFTRVSFAWIHARIEDAGRADLFALRLQIDF